MFYIGRAESDIKVQKEGLCPANHRDLLRLTVALGGVDVLLQRQAEGTKERAICTTLPDSALLSVCIYASAPAGVRHSGTSNPFPPCLQPLQQFYQFISTDKTGVKQTEY